jgi:O-methyltransferase
MNILKRLKNAIAGRIFKFIVTRLNARHIVITRTLVNLSRKRAIRTMYPNLYSDYIRLAALELCAEEIRKKSITGSVAEVGVYMGDFAVHLNHAFEDRTLYLFDTFKGFVEEEISADVKEGLARPKQFLSDVRKVVERMPHKKKVVAVVGEFNKRSFENLPENETFAFVSLDVDIYAPTIEGLRAFYPRLSKGGYIFVHDYSNDDWGGIAKAIREFSQETGACMVPLPDVRGTIIIAK